MTTITFIVGVGLFWFLCFMYVVHGLHRGERTPLLPGGAPDSQLTVSGLRVSPLGRTRVRRGPARGGL